MTDNKLQNIIRQMLNDAFTENDTPHQAYVSVQMELLSTLNICYDDCTKDKYQIPTSILGRFQQLNPTDAQLFAAIDILLEAPGSKAKGCTDHLFYHQNHWTALIPVMIFYGRIDNKKGKYAKMEEMINRLYQTFAPGAEPRVPCKLKDMRNYGPQLTSMDLRDWEAHKSDSQLQRLWAIAYNFLLIIEKVIQEEYNSQQKTNDPNTPNS